MIIKQRLLPDGRPNKPNKPMKPRYITIHNTDNPKGTAECHARYILNGSCGKKVSWHFTVDDKDIYQHLREDEQSWHAGDGDGKGNTTSIGIEVCMYVGMNTERCWRNAAWLVARLLDKHKLNIDRVVPHRHWTGKNCPSQILPYWSRFMSMVRQELMKLQNQMKIVVNGELVGVGKVIDGVTDVPLRAVLEALHIPFTLNGKTIEIEKK